MIHIVFLASGNGGNMKFFHQSILDDLITGVRLTVIADRECGSIYYADNNNIQNYVINYQRSATLELSTTLQKVEPDIIVTNWHKIIDKNTVANYSGRLVNLHYSLLPVFGGLIGIEPIQRAYSKGCKFIGPTCHLVDEEVDSGTILAQAVFPIIIPLEKSIDLMFRKGCLVLLNGIEIILGTNLARHRSISGGMYSPRLTFNESVFDEAFWQKVALA
ncbi:formyltransferase family protein [Methylomonas rapida]|uniref:phosphoribosylglycinamide formyltransferase 1 n=1 Tax=Methylomonas rapida TaxID=2963939 RepID=A0ABY7GIW5_9GAMM|nr:formyltransferase family protein [Methylomonas rapida]WAR44078.1 formyltransferase family protein [Methylomonas rapida]